jgi:REP element-mobilizing transposase RayT
LLDAVMDEEADPRVAQLALNLTQYSLESSAEGTLLTQGGEIIAFAGHLAPEDISDLQAATENDWDAENGARFRFVTLPSSGKDFLLYSIRTHARLTLSMVFAGTTPLRTIREQGRRLAQALQTVPDVAEPPTAVIEVEAAGLQAPLPVQQHTPPPTSAYAYIWLLRDPNASLGQATIQAIHAGLSTQLGENDWRIHTLDVQQDYVYLLADVPGEQPPHEVIRDLKRRSAEIAHAQSPEITPALLWADSYFVLLPGRPLQTEEIHNFINMQRML